MRGRTTAVALALGAVLIGAGSGAAQQPEAIAPMAVLTLDQERLFSGSRFGARSIEALEVQARTLQSENRRIESDLETEEKSLTDRRADMTPEAFRGEADAFDAKVKSIRTAQEAKARDLAAQREAARLRFLQASAPVLAQIMQERGAVAILDRGAIVLSFDRADVTDLAIARIDAVLLDGAATVPDNAGPPTDGTAEPGPAAPQLPPPAAITPPEGPPSSAGPIP